MTLALMLTGCKAPGYKEALTKSRTLIREQLKLQNIPGLAIAVTVDGKTVWSEGFGLADREQNVPVDPSNTRFRIASISKALTAIGMGVLYERGQLQPDSSIWHYLTDFPAKKYRPTVRQVAGHIGGIRHYRGNENESNVRYPTVASGLSIFRDDTLLCKPGTQYNYSSYGFNLLSAVMESAGHQDFLELMQQEVFAPMGMNHTIADHVDSVITGRGRYYLRNGKNAPSVDNSYKWAGGGFLSTANDLAAFGNGLLRNKVIKSETLKLFTASQTLDDGTQTGYGMGFGTGKDPAGRNRFGHSGGAVGGSSNLVIYPDSKMVVVILTNVSGADVSMITDQVAEFFHGTH